MPKMVYALIVATATGLAGLPAHANELDGLEMDVIGIDERPDAAARRIELPEAAPRQSDDEAKPPPPGLDTAAEARERGSEVGQETAEQAREGKGPPDNVGRPDNPGEQGDDNRPDDPGQGNDNRPEDPGQGTPPEQPGNDRPDQPGNGDYMNGGGDRNEPPSDSRPDAGSNEDSPAEDTSRPDETSDDRGSARTDGAAQPEGGASADASLAASRELSR